MIKTILVGLDGSSHSWTAAEHALWLGKRFAATVIGLHVVDIVSIEGSFLRDISGSLGFEPYLDFSSKVGSLLHERGKALLEEFGRRSTDAGVRADTALTTGVVANELAEHAKTTDLLVIGHRGINDRFSTGLLGGTAESVTRKSPIPLFVSTTAFRECDSPVLAYDGSARAAAAMHSAAEFSKTLGLPLTVLTVNKDEAAGRKVLDEAERYLRPFDLRVTFTLQQTGNAPERITNFLRENRHDLLFIGAYGHSRIVEMVLGSTTEYVMRNSPCALFLSR